MNGHRFPHLQKLAKKFLCRPSTSAAIREIVFAAGLTVTKGRAFQKIARYFFTAIQRKTGFKQEVMDDLKMKQKSSTEGPGRTISTNMNMEI